MKITTLILAFGLLLNTATGQNCDIAQTGVAIYNEANTSPVSSLPTGQRANFKFAILNFGTDLGCTIPANTVTAVFDFPTVGGGIKPYIYDGPSSFVSGHFTWTYDPSEEVLFGTNTLPIANGEGDFEVLVKVKANSVAVASSNLNISQGGGISDNIGNNYASTQLVVVAGALPIRLKSFTGFPDKCEAMLKWTTDTEINFSHFEVEYSPDALTYIKVGSVPGKNSSTGSNYGFAYTQISGKGYYRLKQVDINGSVEYSHVVKVATVCDTKSKILVYPNPVHYDQKLTVNISGYTGKLAAELFDAAGRRIKGYELLNQVNELSMINLSAGTYMLNVTTAQGDVQAFKILVTR